MKVGEIELTLPVPPVPENTASPHPMQRHREKNAYRRKAWAYAIQQAMPKMHPPDTVVLSAHFYLHNKRDEDNLTASLKWVLDALKQKQTGNVSWRQGIADRKGYMVDDDPKHVTVLKPTQEIDRSGPRLELVIRWKEGQEAA